jgi:hypothetical protein
LKKVGILIVSYISLFLFGVLIGNFTTTLFYRLPRNIMISGFNQKLTRPPFCSNCNHVLVFYEYLPILSWFSTRGKCNYCHAPINKSYIKPTITEAPLLSFVPSIGISDIDKCPQIYNDYYAPNDCLAVSSLRGQAIDFIVHKNGRVLFTEKIDFKVRIRKIFIRGNTIIAVTDFKGVIIGNLTKLH